MKRSFFSLVLIVAMAAAAPLARAAIIPLHVNLSGANEVPANASNGTGVAYFQLDTITNDLTGHIEFSGLTGTTTAAHIHCCLATPFLTGVNVGVATLVPAFPGFPIGVRSGVDDFVLDLDDPLSYNSAFITAQGGLANAEANFINGLLTGRTYLNIHTGPAGVGFPGGEIRGFVIPEPMTVSLVAMGLAAAAFGSRRRKRS
jgi:hypothetical protein